LAQLRSAAATLGDFPEKLAIVLELGEPYRERFVGRYPIIYRFDGSQVSVLAVKHSARDLLGTICEILLQIGT